jgi:hypothetical protein
MFAAKGKMLRRGLICVAINNATTTQSVSRPIDSKAKFTEKRRSIIKKPSRTSMETEHDYTLKLNYSCESENFHESKLLSDMFSLCMKTLQRKSGLPSKYRFHKRFGSIINLPNHSRLWSVIHSGARRRSPDI